MIQKIEAIYTNGVLKPTQRLDLHEQERVQITVEPLERPNELQRAKAFEEFRAGAAAMNFRSVGPYPTRDELHERR